MSNFVQSYPCFWELDKIGQRKLDIPDKKKIFWFAQKWAKSVPLAKRDTFCPKYFFLIRNILKLVLQF
jgi:hypothetical protein